MTRVAFASFLVGCLVASASSIVVAQSGQPLIINSFGNWRIELEASNQSLRLVGIVTEGGRGFFSVACYASTNWQTILISIFDESEQQIAIKNKYASVSVWNEKGDPVQLRMLTKEGRIVLSLAKPENAASKDIFDSSPLVFLDKLNETKAFFAIELGGPSRTYDAKHLPSARARFASLCEQARSNWTALLRTVK